MLGLLKELANNMMGMPPSVVTDRNNGTEIELTGTGENRFVRVTENQGLRQVSIYEDGNVACYRGQRDGETEDATRVEVAELLLRNRVKLPESFSWFHDYADKAGVTLSSYCEMMPSVTAHPRPMSLGRRRSLS